MEDKGDSKPFSSLRKKKTLIVKTVYSKVKSSYVWTKQNYMNLKRHSFWENEQGHDIVVNIITRVSVLFTIFLRIIIQH